MTAEIGILNKSAIALAADSAVTIQGQKIYNTVNKLFTLSKYHPVGIMVYGNSELMGVPWESIIKIYRKKIGKQVFDTLQEYSEDFISFINSPNPLFPESQQAKYFVGSIISYYDLIKNEINEEIKKVLTNEGKISDGKISEIVSKIIKKHGTIWDKFKKLSHLPEGFSVSVADKYKQEIIKAKETVFEKLNISDNDFSILRQMSGNLFEKENFSNSFSSGVVIAGFGETDVFPRLQHFVLESVVNDKLKYQKVGETIIDFDKYAAIVPFAQREMVDTFMQGIDPRYLNSLEAYLQALFAEYPNAIVGGIDKLDDAEKKDISEKLKKIGDNLLNEFKKIMGEYRKNEHINPIINAVAYLPKDELAAMAESLVNLTSFKQKISMNMETVGGAIDVAVISKGDGFVWIKRKHYFKPELNMSFFKNYYREKEVRDEEV